MLSWQTTGRPTSTIQSNIENVDATPPPHLEVCPAVGDDSGFAGFLEALCDWYLRLLFHVVSFAGPVKSLL